MPLSIHNFNIYRSLRESHIRNIKIQLKAVSTSKLIPKLSRFINKHLYRFGFCSAINRYENSFSFYSVKDDSNLYKEFGDGDLFCNFGSGSFYHRRWINFDYPGQTNYYKSLQGVDGKDFKSIDLCEENLKLPLHDDSVSLIYCAHTLEHLEEQSAFHFLSECYRILKKEGVLRIAVPSTDNHIKIASIIARQDSVPADMKKKVARQVGHNILADTSALKEEEVLGLFFNTKFEPTDFYSKCIDSGVSNSFNPSNPERHITFWNYEKLCYVSYKLGFQYCIPLYRGSSLARPFENLNVFDTTEPHISLYVEFVK